MAARQIAPATFHTVSECRSSSLAMGTKIARVTLGGLRLGRPCRSYGRPRSIQARPLAWNELPKSCEAGSWNEKRIVCTDTRQPTIRMPSAVMSRPALSRYAAAGTGAGDSWAFRVEGLTTVVLERVK